MTTIKISIHSLSLALLLVYGLSMTNSCTKEIPGCIDPDSINYNPSADIDDGSCQYEGQLLVWFDKSVSDFFIGDGTTSLNFFLDGVLSGSTPTNIYFADAPDCGAPNTATLTKDLGHLKGVNVILTVKAQDGFEYLSEELMIVSNFCITHRITSGQKKLISLETDIDSNQYHIVKIGDRWWFAENLRTTRYNDGTAIPMATPTTDWSNYEEQFYCWYNFDPGFKDIYGGLYNSWVANSKKVCPVGWHVSTDVDWLNMLRLVDPNAQDYSKEPSGIAGGGLKSLGTIEGSNGLWHAPNTGATNVLGFNGLPGGYVTTSSFNGMGYYGVWWLEFEIRSVDYGSSVVSGAETGSNGYSIRCVKNL